MLSFLPTAAAARSNVDNVAELLSESSSRSTAARLVFMRRAISLFEMFCSSMSWES